MARDRATMLPPAEYVMGSEPKGADKLIVLPAKVFCNSAAERVSANAVPGTDKAKVNANSYRTAMKQTSLLKLAHKDGWTACPQPF